VEFGPLQLESCMCYSDSYNKKEKKIVYHFSHYSQHASRPHIHQTCPGFHLLGSLTIFIGADAIYTSNYSTKELLPGQFNSKSIRTTWEKLLSKPFESEGKRKNQIETQPIRSSGSTTSQFVMTSGKWIGKA
jgi:hypothetical protein